MELKPVTSYRQPGYPTRDILRDQPELLRATPVRWQRNAVLASVLATSLTLVLPAWAGDEGVRPSIQCPVPAEQSLIDTDNEPRLMGDVSISPTATPQGLTILKVAPDQAIRVGNVLTTPVRLVAQHLGAQVQYDANTRATTIIRDGATLVLTKGRTAIVNGVRVTLPVPVCYRHSTLYAPARFLAEHLGGQVKWYEQTDAVAIISEQKEELQLTAPDRQAQQPRSVQPAVTLDQRREALRDYIAWLKVQEMI